MVAVIVQWPLGNHRFGLFSLQKLRELVVVRFIDDRMAISLSRIRRPRL